MTRIALVGEFDAAFPPHPATTAACARSACALREQITATWISTQDATLEALRDVSGAGASVLHRNAVRAAASFECRAPPPAGHGLYRRRGAPRMLGIHHHTFAGSEIPEAYGPYSHAVVAGDFVFVAGQIARDSATGKLIDGDIAAQTTRCLEIIAGILARLQLTLGDVVRATVYLNDLADFDAMSRVYRAAFGDRYPARSTPQVKLPFGALVGIEVTAYRSPRG